MGPRGSGKTTLLKMLTPEGTERRATSDPGFLGLAFSGLYVPIDVQLSDQLDSISRAGLEPELTEAGVKTLYAFHAFRCIAKSFSWHCPSSSRHSNRTLLSLSVEADAVESLADLWQVNLGVPTIGSLQRALRVRQMKAVEKWNRQVLRHRAGLDIDTDSVDIMDLDVGLKGAIEIIGEFSTWASGGRWAVLFDEVEVAPESLQKHLLSYLRHSDDDVLFKVAIAPYMQAFRGLPARARASALNDYGVVDLQAATDKEVDDFSSAFFKKAAASLLDRDLTIYGALGDSILVGSGSRDAEASYGPRSPQAQRMASLAQKDPSFISYLAKNHLTPDDLLRDSASDERAPVRKIRQVALVRETYIRDSSQSVRRIKSQVSPGRLYVGAAGVMGMCEGNPRRLAFITPMLIAGVREDGLIPYGVQVDAVSRTEAAFRSFLRGLPVSEDLGKALPRGLLSFVDLLGRAFHSELVTTDFPEDPVGSFTVDSNADEATEELVARGVNSGALVQLSDRDSRGVQQKRAAFDPIISSRGKRFRLSYILSPGYGLTQRVGRPISLSTLLQRTSETGDRVDKRVSASLLDTQRSLW
jgi:hypothetical protein